MCRHGLGIAYRANKKRAAAPMRKGLPVCRAALSAARTSPKILLGGLGGLSSRVERSLLGSELRAELFHAASFDDARLCARIEGVAGRRRIKLEHRIGHAVNLNGFLRLNGGADDERLVDGKVDESDFAVFGVNIRLHLKRNS